MKGGYTLTICAAGQGVTTGGIPVPLVCGRPPGHDGPHHDIEWAVKWPDKPPKNAFKNAH
jgi:hypothetical protein